EKLLKSKNQDKELEVSYNPEEGEVELFEYKEVVQTVNDSEVEISLDEASELDPETELGDIIGVKISPEYTRIAIHNAKQKVLQKLKEAEGKVIYEEFIGRKGTIIGGIVRRVDRRHIIVDLGRAEAVLPPDQQVPREYYKMKERIRAVLLDIRESPRGEPRLILSRAHTSFVMKLFESEVPEITEKIVQIKAISRDPGGRTKIAVTSNDSDVDAVGACVGMRGSRVQSIIQELRGEKVDIVPWSEDSARYVCNALSPAVVNKVVIDENSRSMDVIVDDDQLSLAIGRKGQNVRLASQLTEWKIDIKTESRVKQEQQEVLSLLTSLPSVSEVTASLLYNDGFYSLEHIAFCEPDVLMKVGSLNEEEVSTLQKAARMALMEKLEEIPVESGTDETSTAEEGQTSPPPDADVEVLQKDGQEKTSPS
ncbi:MAG: transcription termination factor NusA, partial [Candidatus Dadabacteria bacterium]|nr:transcription termination factor NusA [Candidatus Dadabacteria bacterium]